MTRPDRISDFCQLGASLGNVSLQGELAEQACRHNGWFTAENTHYALQSVLPWLNRESLSDWMNAYPEPGHAGKIGVVAAGNIPLAGFHDFMCILLAGHRLDMKLSSQDNQLIPLIFNILCQINPWWADRCSFVDRIRGCDAVIATGSNNTARYFEYYFRHTPLLLRRNRNAAAVLNGAETDASLKGLADDIMRYFGLGCRSVSHLLVPEGYNLDRLIGNMVHWHHLADHHKYANSLTYQRAILMVDLQPFTENGLCLFRCSDQIASPVSVVHYSTYRNHADAIARIKDWGAQLQCVVSHEGWIPGCIPFGTAQQPRLEDYADGIDTMQFVTAL